MPGTSMSSLPFPPLDLLRRTGRVEDDNPVASYDDVGLRVRHLIDSMLPPDWNWSGKRVLDFGCGAGRVLRHFAPEAAEGEFWGCDIDGRSIDWLAKHLSPPFQVLQCDEAPGLPFPDGTFDLIYAMSVYTHIGDQWADWLLEHHRLLAEGGLLIATFLGEGMIEQLTGEQWSDDTIGMNTLLAGNPWDLGGPITLQSPWWIEAHWGRAFDIVTMKLHDDDKPIGHGKVLLRRKPVRLTVEDLEMLEPSEPREVSALQHLVKQLRRETLELRRIRDEREALLDEQILGLRQSLASMRTSSSWKITAPLRAAGGLLRRSKSAG